MNKPSAAAVKAIKLALTDPNHPAFASYDLVFSTRTQVDAASCTVKVQNHLNQLALAGYVKKVTTFAGTTYSPTGKHLD